VAKLGRGGPVLHVIRPAAATAAATMCG
jgi:hypothetical protein